MKIAKSLLFIVVVLSLGCTETRKASAKYTTVGGINANAPIIKEPKKKEVQPTQEMEQKKFQTQLSDEYEKVGYIVNVQREPSSGLYVYTLTNALRTSQIQFYSKTELPYSERDLIRVYVKDNYVFKHDYYRTVNGKRQKSFLEAAKEYIISL